MSALLWLRGANFKLGDYLRRIEMDFKVFGFPRTRFRRSLKRDIDPTGIIDPSPVEQVSDGQQLEYGMVPPGRGAALVTTSLTLVGSELDRVWKTSP